MKEGTACRLDGKAAGPEKLTGSSSSSSQICAGRRWGRPLRWGEGRGEDRCGGEREEGKTAAPPFLFELLLPQSSRRHLPKKRSTGRQCRRAPGRPCVRGAVGLLQALLASI
uniref:Uncharacterized protein n=1 Tax=Oryza meridionalis TaxID=40149 RepID=A0A0E0CJI4_9ORYZ